MGNIYFYFLADTKEDSLQIYYNIKLIVGEYNISELSNREGTLYRVKLEQVNHTHLANLIEEFDDNLSIQYVANDLIIATDEVYKSM